MHRLDWITVQTSPAAQPVPSELLHGVSVGSG
jgi:hypothetical protein